jgi:hypothetical protein
MCGNVLWAFATMRITPSVELTALLTKTLADELRNDSQLVSIDSLGASLWGLTKSRLSLSHSLPIGGSPIKHKPVYDLVALAVPLLNAAQVYLDFYFRNASDPNKHEV